MLNKFKRIGRSGGSRLVTRGTLFGRFANDNKGVAAVEFALLAPLMVTLMLGALEVTQSIWADGKVEQATSTIGDLVSRTPEMSDIEYRNLGEAGPLVLRPNPQNDLKFIVTSIIGCLQDPSEPATSDLDYYVLWSRVWQGGNVSASPYNRDQQFTQQPASLDIADGDTLIVTEGSYNYSPTISRTVGQSWEMGGYAFHQPRDKSKRISYPGVESATPKTCDDFRNT